MIRPSEVYRKATKQQVIDWCKRHGYRIIAFRQPIGTIAEMFLYNAFAPEASEGHNICYGNSDGSNDGMRLIVEKVEPPA